VANGTTGMPEMVAADESAADGFAAGGQAVSDAKGKDLFEKQKDIDYLDIPAFLRTQAD
jgi:hypothetical protein